MAGRRRDVTSTILDEDLTEGVISNRVVLGKSMKIESSEGEVESEMFWVIPKLEH